MFLSRARKGTEKLRVSVQKPSFFFILSVHFLVFWTRLFIFHAFITLFPRFCATFAERTHKPSFSYVHKTEC